jgi:hypothetical protein
LRIEIEENFSCASVNTFTRHRSVRSYFKAPRDRGKTLEITMAIAQRTAIESARSEIRDYDGSIILGSVALMIVFLIAIYLGFISGAVPGEFAAMTVYP